MFLKDAAAFILASWILPNSKILDVGALHHIDFVLKNPRKFGLTPDDVKDCVRYGEGIEKGVTGVTTYRDGIEAKAHEKVINKVIENGFIRTRKVRSGKYSFIWYADVDQFSHRAKRVLSDWAYNLLNNRNSDTEVIISVLKGDVPQGLNLNSLANLMEAHELLQLTTFDEMPKLA